MIDKQQINELKRDVHTLLDCLKYQADNPPAVKQALLTLSSIFSNYDCRIKDYFHEIGGIQFVFSMITSVTNSEVKEAALFTIGCCVEKNVYSQKMLSTTSTFRYIHGLLSDEGSASRIKQTATFFLLCLVSNNSQGQILAKESLCLADLLELLRTTLPKNLKTDMSKKESWFDDAGSTSLELWSSVASTLCMCVNNPQNEENQRVCGFVLPYMFNVFEEYRNTLVVRSLMSLIGFVVSNNSSNQDQVRRCGGLHILIRCLKHVVKQGQKSPESAHLAIQITSTIDSCITDNVENCEEIGSQGAIKLMLDLLNTECLDDASKLQLVVTLGHAVESCDRNKKEINEENGLTRLIQHLTDTEDEELSKAVKYLLQICVSNKVTHHNMYEKEHSASPNRNEIMHMQSELVLLQKINEITDRLKTIEQQSVLDTKQLNISQFTSTTNPAVDLSNPLVPTDVCLTPREKSLLSELHRERKERQRLELITRQHLQSANRKINTDYVGDIAENKFVNQHQSVHNNMMDDFQNPLFNRDIYVPDCSGDYINMQKESSTREAYCTDPRLNPLQLPGVQNNRNPLFQNKHSEHNLSNFCSPGNQEEYYSNIYTEKINDSRKNPNFAQNLNRILSEDSIRNKNVEQMSDRNQRLLSSSSVLQQNKSNHPSNFVFASPANRHIMALHVDSNQRLSDYEPCSSKIDNLGPNVRKPFQSDCDMSSVDNLHKKKDVLPQHEITSSDLTDAEAQNKLGASSHCDISHDVITSTTENSKEPESRNPTSTLSRNNLCKLKSVDKTCEDSQSQTRIPPSDFCKNRLTEKTACNSTVLELNTVKNLSEQKECNTTALNESNKSLDMETSNTTFKKPVGVPPRRKQTRMTKPLGVDEVFISDTMSCSDIQSEFDCQLLECATKGFRGSSSFIKPSLPVDRNYLINEFTKPNGSDIGTPKHQGIPCVKPVYSDVGPGKDARRYLINNKVNPIYSVKPLPKPYYLSTGNKSFTDVDECDNDKEMWLRNKQTSKLEITMEKKKLKKDCPGCVVPTENGDLDSQPLNSRTYNLIIETNGDTCQSHRYIREIERKYIQARKEIKKNTTSGQVKRLKKRKPLLELHRKNNPDLLCDEKQPKPDESIYDIPSSDSEPQKGNVTPPRSTTSAIKSVLSRNQEHTSEKRRQRVPYTEEEINNILTGVKTFGTRWNQILCTYVFHPTRKAVDLSDKYKRMMKREKEDGESTKSVTSRHEPFSMCEDRRLVRGVKLYGYSWKTILHSFQFAKCRTSEDLRLRWRTMHQKPGVLINKLP